MYMLYMAHSALIIEENTHHDMGKRKKCMWQHIQWEPKLCQWKEPAHVTHVIATSNRCSINTGAAWHTLQDGHRGPTPKSEAHRLGGSVTSTSASAHRNCGKFGSRLPHRRRRLHNRHGRKASAAWNSIQFYACTSCSQRYPTLWIPA